MADFIVAVLLLVLVGASVFYIIRTKKRGVKCIGCPVGNNCMYKKRGNSCGSGNDK